MNIKIVISGFGGQGIKFLSLILAKTCIKNGKYCTLLFSYGPEARGGSSAGYLTISDNYISNPIINKPNWLVAFNEIAYNTWKDRSENVIFEKDLDNMIMLGKLTKHLNFDIEPMIETMRSAISSKYADRIQANIDNMMKGFNSVEYIPKV